MLKRIFLATILSLSLISLLFIRPISTEALLKGWTPPEEESLSSEANGNNPLGIVIEPSQDNQNGENNKPMNGIQKSDYPDLGSDQVFPFVAGLDSYSNY